MPNILLFGILAVDVLLSSPPYVFAVIEFQRIIDSQNRNYWLSLCVVPHLFFLKFITVISMHIIPYLQFWTTFPTESTVFILLANTREISETKNVNRSLLTGEKLSSALTL